VLALIKHYGVNAKPIGSGAAAITLTQAMSKQIDAGWASPPFGLQQLQEGQIRIIARGSDVPSTRDQTVRVHIVNANVLAQRADVINRFVKAYRESYDFLYDNPEGAKIYAQYAKISEPLAARIRDEFLPKAALNPDRVSGIDALTQDAIAFKVLQAPLTQE
jgi:NitT/TauT family transport system substrate-binding protein